MEDVVESGGASDGADVHTHDALEDPKRIAKRERDRKYRENKRKGEASKALGSARLTRKKSQKSQLSGESRIPVEKSEAPKKVSKGTKVGKSRQNAPQASKSAPGSTLDRLPKGGAKIPKSRLTGNLLRTWPLRPGEKNRNVIGTYESRVIPREQVKDRDGEPRWRYTCQYRRQDQSIAGCGKTWLEEQDGKRHGNHCQKCRALPKAEIPVIKKAPKIG